MSPRVTGRVGRGNPADAPAASPAVLALTDSVTTDALQAKAEGLIHRRLTADEMAWLVQRFFTALDQTLDSLFNALPLASSPSVDPHRLRELAEAMDVLADKHTEQLYYEGYAGLTEHAAELKSVASVLDAEDPAAVVARMIAQAEDHLLFIRELCEGGDA
ncbi:hypothetical protein Pla108_14220 [Botrimarina colliarenosi]|uniref:Uncharacterized protein n=1 Tax=Botrimarina colliarenosi TaxID=2528001 RepID=A0A5C6AM26_9BACT|nr:hypothetical protein [Botrimarina colliarenosi]TWU00471.1 hypothetical protein Pla108_14220 [Botrimarina colliarenosi]